MYEGLPNIFFSCRGVGHGADGCDGSPGIDSVVVSKDVQKGKGLSSLEKQVSKENFEEWMMVEKRRGRSQGSGDGWNAGVSTFPDGSCFSVLNGENNFGSDEN